MHAGGLVTLTSSAQGAICPREEVTLMCTVAGGVSLEWSATFDSAIRYAQNVPEGRARESGILTATLPLVISNPIPSFTPTLRVT